MNSPTTKFTLLGYKSTTSDSVFDDRIVCVVFDLNNKPSLEDQLALVVTLIPDGLCAIGTHPSTLYLMFSTEVGAAKAIRSLNASM